MWTSHGGWPVLARLWLGRGSSHPRKARLMEKPEDWRWSGLRHYLTGSKSVAKIESATDGPSGLQNSELPRPSQNRARTGHPILKAISRLECVWPGYSTTLDEGRVSFDSAWRRD